MIAIHARAHTFVEPLYINTALSCPVCGGEWDRCVCDPDGDDEPEYAGAFEAPNRETEQ